MANPYPWYWSYVHGFLKGADVAAANIDRWWRGAEPPALRIRHGARQACARLRRERDEARDRATSLAWNVESLDRQLDAARRELRALEWLVSPAHRDDCVVHGDGTYSTRRGVMWTRHATALDAARALGMPEEP